MSLDREPHRNRAQGIALVIALLGTGCVLGAVRAAEAILAWTRREPSPLTEQD